MNCTENKTPHPLVPNPNSAAQLICGNLKKSSRKLKILPFEYKFAKKANLQCFKLTFSGQSVLDQMEIALWSSHLHIKSAENVFYWLIAKSLTFESALAVLKHPHFDIVEPSFAKVVMYYVIKNMDQKTSNGIVWSSFKKKFPSLIARLYNVLMEISMVRKTFEIIVAYLTPSFVSKFNFARSKNVRPKSNSKNFD